MITIEFVIVIISIIGNTTLSLIAYKNNTKSKTHLYFLILSTLLSIYIYFNFLAISATTDQAALFWIKNKITIASFINLIFLLLALTFPKNKFKLHTWLSTLLISSTLLIAGLTQTNLIFESVIQNSNIPLPGKLFLLFFIQTIVFFVWSFIALLIKLKKLKGLQKDQIKIFLLGTIGMFASIVITHFFVVVIFKYTFFTELLPLYTLIFVGSVWYSIVKQRLFDINHMIARSIIYSIMILFIAFFYTSYLFLISTLISGEKLQISNLITSTILALIVITTFQPIKRFIEESFSPIFFKSVYSSNELFSNLSKIMSVTLQLDTLIKKLLIEITQTFKIQSAHFLILDNKKINTYPNKGLHLDKNELSIIQTFLQKNKTLIFEEMKESKIKKIMRKNNIKIAKSLKVKNKQIGILLLGSKYSGDMFSTRDIKNINIFVPEIAIAINNSILYEQIKRFNITLEEKVKKATKALKLANKELKQLDKLKDEFVSIASHELRTPMTAIKSYLWMVINKSKSLTQKDKKYLNIAYNSTERLLTLVNDMLVISKIEEHRLELDIKKVNLVKISKQVINELKIKAKRKKINLTLITKIPNVYIDGDANKLSEVIQNLIGNALKFTPEKGNITLQIRLSKDKVLLDIIDNGLGIPTKDIDKLFIKFSKLYYSYKNSSNVKGTGLGLYISKQIITLHKGSITVKSKIKEGTTFTISLPAFKE